MVAWTGPTANDPIQQEPEENAPVAVFGPRGAAGTAGSLRTGGPTVATPSMPARRRNYNLVSLSKAGVTQPTARAWWRRRTDYDKHRIASLRALTPARPRPEKPSSIITQVDNSGTPETVSVEICTSA